MVNAINRELAQLLLAWYDVNRRDLPWRGTRDAYRVWVSEVMLQQTRAETVKEYYLRFINALPEIADLAAVDEDRLLKLWQGLGYYSRARNLQKAAHVVMTEYGGELPADPEALLHLPGVGLYTAGAVASIAYGVCVPAVDGNALRVCKRLEGSREDIALEVVKKAAAARLLAVLPPDRPGDFNQAIMDLGATVCLPGAAARCEACPLQGGCVAFQQGIAAELPVKSPLRPRKTERRTVLVIRCKERVALRKRPAKGLLAGLWEFPNAPFVNGGWQSLSEALNIPAQSVLSAEDIGAARHIFTHIEWHMYGYRLELADFPENSALHWVTPAALADTYALPSAFTVFLAAMQEK